MMEREFSDPSRLEVRFYGPLVEHTGVERCEVSSRDFPDLENLLQGLRQRYPGLAGVQFAIAVDEQLRNENVLFRGPAVVALLPPFSGG